MPPGPRHLVISVARENDLEQLQGSEPEIGNAAGEVETPGTDEAFVEHFPYPLQILLETCEPLFARFGVVQPQVFHIQYRELARFEERHHLSYGGRVAAGKHAPQEPGTHRSRTVLPDGVDQPNPLF